MFKRKPKVGSNQWLIEQAEEKGFKIGFVMTDKKEEMIVRYIDDIFSHDLDT